MDHFHHPTRCWTRGQKKSTEEFIFIYILHPSCSETSALPFHAVTQEPWKQKPAPSSDTCTTPGNGTGGPTSLSLFSWRHRIVSRWRYSKHHLRPQVTRRLVSQSVTVVARFARHDPANCVNQMRVDISHGWVCVPFLSFFPGEEISFYFHLSQVHAGGDLVRALERIEKL